MSQDDSGNQTNLPPHTQAFLNTGPWHLPGVDDQACQGAVYHSPRPMFVRSTPLIRPDWYEDGDFHWQDRAPSAYLCGTCSDNLSILLQMLHATEGDLEWEVRREFGNAVRALALRGWGWFAAHRPASDLSPDLNQVQEMA